MGGLYASEYWTYTLPRHVGQEMAFELTESCQPLGTRAAQSIGFIDAAFGANVAQFEAPLTDRAEELARDSHFWNRLKAKQSERLADERSKPLAVYRQKLARMRINFYGADPSYHDAGERFVYKRTPPPLTCTQLRSAKRTETFAGE